VSCWTEISPDPNLKTLICTVEEGIQLGADGVSIHINLGSDNESRMLSDFGIIGKKCADWGMPLLAMMYTRGKNLSNDTARSTRIAARVASELGADIVKVNFTGDVDSFRSVVEGCSIPVVVAGGQKVNDTCDEDSTSIPVQPNAGSSAYTLVQFRPLRFAI
jgi:fructose-bisphosphate aldolase/2-amino-3,7-dideoxy-D-threo-hept-6-ulosonate synthase